MPDARIAPEGSWRTGFSFLRPYEALWSSLAIFPWLEGSFRYTRIYHVPGFAGTPDNPEFGSGFGDFKDKSFDAKLRVLPERGWWPAVALGMQDAGGGTQLFQAPYGVASKRFGELDLTLGYGKQRIDGAFGGVRWSPSAAPNWSLVAEYDAFNYAQDFGAQLSGAAAYKKEVAYGVEYRSEWWGAKAFSSHGELGFNAYLNVPLERREFVPKIHEPAPYTKINPRPTEAQWREDAAHRARLVRALIAQDFRNIALRYEGERLEAVLTNTRISSMPRAVGRAARTLLSFAPLEVREIRVTYIHGALPVATYSFVNVPLLQRYFNGFATREMLAPYVAIEYAQPGEARAERDRAEALAAFEEPLPEALVVEQEGAELIGLVGRNVLGGRFTVRPSLSVYFNDPSGAFKYDLALVARYDRALTRQMFLEAATRLTVSEDVSDVTQPSNSLLPHVRTDIAEYKRGSDFKLTRLLVNRLGHPAERVYTRLSGGIYEEMFSGIGGQALYVGEGARWGVDLDANLLRQRDFEGWFGHFDYTTFTAIASLNYRMAYGLTATLRAGRFLAQDEGVRGEIRRRFASGVEIGAWYTVTNGNDITSPGSPDSPYRDKGIFLYFPLEPLQTRDTNAAAAIALSPWTRDVGQMVVSPGDLWGLVERPLRQMNERDGLVRFGDRDDDYDLPWLGVPRERRWPEFVAADAGAARRASGEVDWVRTGLLGAGLVLGSAALDKSADRYAKEHQDAKWMKDLVRVGDALPVAALGLSGVFALDESRPRLSDAGVAALEAGAVALVAAEGLKYAFGRAPPNAEVGSGRFDPGEKGSLPSGHTALMWAAVTPYAKEFDLPWLYGVAAITNVARVGSREHWLSDTVAGATLGYVVGHLAWEARRESRRSRGAPALAIGPGKVGLRWDLE
jgi:membrane-associated phospholipid phosphatase